MIAQLPVLYCLYLAEMAGSDLLYPLQANSNDSPAKMKRRLLMLSAAAIAASVPAYRFVRASLEPLPEFETLIDPFGFRQISGGASSSGADPWVGLDGGKKKQIALVSETEVRGNICGALYGESFGRSDVVPIASFSDYYCPYCRIQTKRLAVLANELESQVRVIWHELPLLGDTSLLAAKAALAAKRQGAYVQFHDRLISTPFSATPEYLSGLADAIGVDHARLIADMDGESVLREIEQSAVLSEIFAFIGTPAMVIGRTVIQGQVSDQTLRNIVELERAEGWSQVC